MTPEADAQREAGTVWPDRSGQASATGRRVVSVAQMQQIDRAAIDTIGIPRLLLMEHAGLAVARAVRRILPESGQPCLVCCGMGYNGGDGLGASRHLAQWGYRPTIVFVGSVRQLTDEPAVYARILRALQVPMIELDSAETLKAVEQELARTRVIIDAVLGMGLVGPVRPLTAGLIALMNRAGKPIVAVDVPSGLDADSGMPQGIAVHATVTVTLGLAKQGLFRGEGPAHVGTLVVEEIGFPPSLLQG